MTTIACPNCKCINPWNGDFVDFPCRSCGRTLHIRQLAHSLVHLFCNDANNIDGEEEGFEEHLFKAIANSLWGRGAGRWGWWYANCPTNIQELSSALHEDNDLVVSPLMGFLVGKSASKSLINYHAEIADAAISALQRRPNDNVRWSLYTLLSNIPRGAAVPVIEELRRTFPEMDGDDTRPIGRASADALAKCRHDPDAQPGSQPDAAQ